MHCSLRLNQTIMKRTFIIWGVLILGIIAIMLFQTPRYRKTYRYVVRLESCSNRPDRIIEYQSSSRPRIFVSTVGVLPRFINEVDHKDKYMNICSFKVLEMQLVKVDTLFAL